jgi:hypothetical protein
MNGRIKTLVGAAVLGGSLIAGVPAIAADVAVGVSPGGIAFGYNDGYWDRGRNWHAWQSHEEHEGWRTANRAHYYDWKHDRDHDQGWRDHDRYWDRRTERR